MFCAGRDKRYVAWSFAGQPESSMHAMHISRRVHIVHKQISIERHARMQTHLHVLPLFSPRYLHDPVVLSLSHPDHRPSARTSINITMPPLAFSANMVPAIRVKSTAAGRRIKFIKPLMNGNSWIICSAPTSRQWDWSSGPGISRKHPGVDLGQNSFVIGNRYLHILLCSFSFSSDR